MCAELAERYDDADGYPSAQQPILAVKKSAIDLYGNVVVDLVFDYQPRFSNVGTLMRDDENVYLLEFTY